MLERQIHHALCVHGGERWIAGAPVAGYEPKTKTVCPYHGCHFHGYKNCFPNDRQEIVKNGETRDKVRIATAEQTATLEAHGFRVIENAKVRKRKNLCQKKQTRTYPHAIFYDFESWRDKTQRKEVTTELTYKTMHMPISVSIGDPPERERAHICNLNKKLLIQKFMEELERRGKNTRAVVRSVFMPEDLHMCTAKRRRALVEWFDQVPILGFNSGRYDLNLIKEHFAELLADTTGKVQIGRNAIPGASYDEWVKAYGCSLQKSWFPYE